MRAKLTDALLEREQETLKKSGEPFRIIWDDGLVPGFGARISPRLVSYFVNYNVLGGGKERRQTVARLGLCTTEQARKRAAKVRLEVLAGVDPMAERKKKRQAEREAELAKFTLQMAYEQWVEAHKGEWKPTT